jgi:phosphatidylglycerol---prolipoprotein diacylglyceryl transferase
MFEQPLVWNFDPTMIVLSIDWYFIWILLTVVYAGFHISSIYSKKGTSEKHLNQVLFISTIVMVIGSRITIGLLTQADYYFSHPLDLLLKWDWTPELKFEREIRWYGLLFAASFVFGTIIGNWIYKREGKNHEELDRLVFYLAIGTVVGARLGHSIFYNPSYYFSNPIRILKIWEGGLASHGAGIGLLLAVYLYARKYKDITFFWVFDRLTIVIALSGSLIRTGNLLNSEIIGKPTQASWGVIFKHIDLIPRHPVQVYEAISYLTIFVILLLFYLKWDKARSPGFLTGTAFILGFVVRFFIEFYKIKQSALQGEPLLNMGQILSIPAVLFGCFVLYRSLKRSAP